MGQLTATGLDKIDQAAPSVQSLSTKASAPKARPRPTVGDVRNLEKKLTKHQLSSARIIVALQKEIESQSKRHDGKEEELPQTTAQLKSLLPAHNILMVKPTVTGPHTIIDMADDTSDSDSRVSRMTGESVGQTSAVESLQTQSLDRVTKLLTEPATTAVEVTGPTAPMTEEPVPPTSSPVAPPAPPPAAPPAKRELMDWLIPIQIVSGSR